MNGHIDGDNGNSATTGHERPDDAAIAPPSHPEGVCAPGNGEGAAALGQPVRTHHDVLSLIGEVEQQLERMRVAQTRSAEEYAQFADRGRRLDERDHELRTREAQVMAREAELRSMDESLHEETRRLGERKAEFEEREAALAERERTAADYVAALRERDNAMAEREEYVERIKGATDAERMNISAMRIALRQESESVAKEREALAAERESAATGHAEASRRIEELERRIAEAVAERDEARGAAERFAAERGSIEADRDALAAACRERQEALAAAERNEASLMLTIAQLREMNDDAESSLRSRDEVVEAKDRLIAEREARVADLEREVEMTRHSLRTAGEKLAALAKSVADQAPQLERGAAAIAIANEQRLRIESQEARLAELEERLRAAEAAAGAPREKVVERVVETVVDDAALEQARIEIDRLREEIAGAEREASKAREALAERSVREGDHEKAIADTQAKLDAALGFLRTRKRRVDLARRLLRERKVRRETEVREATENAMVRVLEEERLVKKQREDLRQVQELLTTSERDMVSRYARHRGSLVAAWLMIVMAAVAGGSWFAAPMVMPGTSVASVDLHAKGKDGEAVTPEADALFQSVHRDALADEGMRNAVKKRLAERGLNSLKGVELDAWLDGVRVDSDGPGSMRLVAEGPDPQTAVVALDTLATTLVNESPKLGKGKGDVPRAGIVGNTQTPGRLTFSTLLPQQEPWDRLIAAGLLFSGVVTVGLIGGAVVFGRIARAKRRFEDAERFGATL